MAEWFRVLDLKSGGPYCHLHLFSVVPNSTPQPRCLLKIANWSASHQLGFLIDYSMFYLKYSVTYLQCLISTTVLNTYNT